MEHRSEQQPVNPTTVSLSPGYPPPAPYYAAPAPIPRPGRFLRFRRTTRLLLRRLLYGLARLGRVLRPYAAFIVLTVALLGVIGWMGFQLWAPKGNAPVDKRVTAMTPAQSVETFIQGKQNYNADLVWDSYSPTFQANQLQKGASKQTLKLEMERERSMGIHYSKYDYVGGVNLTDGGNMFFYAVEYEISNQHIKVPATFLVDPDGKVKGIMTVSALDLISN